MRSQVSVLRKISLYGCASLATLMLFVAPSHAEQQLFNFAVNGATSNDKTDPAFGGPQTSFQTGCCRTYYGPGQGPHDAPVLPGGFTTTSSGPGAIREATGQFVGVNGSAVTGTRATDAYDGYGVIGLRQGGSIVTNYAGLTVNRQVDTTHGVDGGSTPITANFASAGVYNAARWVDTFTNNTGATISGTAAYFNNLGSDAGTTWVASSSGNNLASTGNRWLTSIQAGTPTDPVNTQVFGNNAFATSLGTMVHANGSDLPEWQYAITVNPGQTKTIILFNVLTADINYGTSTVAADIALGGQLADLITNNGAAISPDSVSFKFFADLSRDQLLTVANYTFVGLTIDVSRPFFTENDYAVAQSTAIFDGGVLKPTTSVIFNQNFQLNAAGGTVDNSNGVQTFNGVFSGSGPITFTGANSTILTGANTYTGATNVNGGALVVNGSIASSSLTTVNTGATLTGTGTVGNTLVAAGGTLQPGSSTAGTSMAITGNLAFQSGAFYLVQLSPTAANFVNVSGTASLAGTVKASFSPGTYITRQYDILHSAGLGGTQFTAVSTPGFGATLSYSTTDVFLNLYAKLGADSALTPNQQNVASSINNFFNSGGVLPPGFGTLFGLSGSGLGNALNQLSGQGATGSQQTTFNAMNQFMGVMTDPFVAGRGDPVSAGGAPNSYADESLGYAGKGAGRNKSERDAYAAVYTKAPPAPGFEQRWSVWAAGFGGSQQTDGNATVGSNNVTSSIYGTAVGADYRISRDTLVGFALAGGGTNFTVANALGGGRSDLFQAGAFFRHNAGPVYIAGALAYGWQDVTTDRTLTVAGIDRLRAEFNANTYSGRLEGGYRIVTNGVGWAPYAAGQFTVFDLPAYAEQAIVGSNQFALAYNAKSVTDSRSELGLRADKSFAQADGIVTLRGRLAWAHDFNPDRAVGATFQTLPGASFVVNGAAMASESALVTASIEKKWLSGWSAAGTFEGEFSNVTRSYAGKGVVRYAW